MSEPVIKSKTELARSQLYAEIDRLRAALRHVCISSDICGYVWLHEICDGCRCSRAKIAKEGK